MTATQFRSALDRLGLTQTRAAELMGVRDRAARRWAAGDSAVPHAVGILLRLLERGKITEADL